MQVRFIDQLNINGLQGHTNLFPTGSYIGLILYVKGVHTSELTEQTLLDRVRLNFRGDDIVNANWTNLRIFCDLEYGLPLNVTGNTGTYGIFIPFYHPDLPNAIRKRIRDNMDFYIDASLITCATSCTCDIYGVLDDIPEIYVPKLIDYLDTAGAGQVKIGIDQDNIAQILVYKPATTAQTLLQLFVDNELTYSWSWDVGTILSNIIAKIEALALDVVVFDLVTKGMVNESLSDYCELLSTGGVGDFNYLVQSFTFTPSLTIQTALEVRDKLNTRIQKKANIGKTGGTVVSAIVDEKIVSPETKNIIKRRPEYQVQVEELQYGKTKSVVR